MASLTRRRSKASDELKLSSQPSLINIGMTASKTLFSPTQLQNPTKHGKYAWCLSGNIKTPSFYPSETGLLSASGPTLLQATGNAHKVCACPFFLLLLISPDRQCVDRHLAHGLNLTSKRVPSHRREWLNILGLWFGKSFWSDALWQMDVCGGIHGGD